MSQVYLVGELKINESQHAGLLEKKELGLGNEMDSQQQTIRNIKSYLENQQDGSPDGTQQRCVGLNCLREAFSNW